MNESCLVQHVTYMIIQEQFRTDKLLNCLGINMIINKDFRLFTTIQKKYSFNNYFLNWIRERSWFEKNFYICLICSVLLLDRVEIIPKIIKLLCMAPWQLWYKYLKNSEDTTLSKYCSLTVNVQHIYTSQHKTRYKAIYFP